MRINVTSIVLYCVPLCPRELSLRRFNIQEFHIKVKLLFEQPFQCICFEILWNSCRVEFLFRQLNRRKKAPEKKANQLCFCPQFPLSEILRARISFTQVLLEHRGTSPRCCQSCRHNGNNGHCNSSIRAILKKQVWKVIVMRYSIAPRLRKESAASKNIPHSDLSHRCFIGLHSRHRGHFLLSARVVCHLAFRCFDSPQDFIFS